MGPRYVAGAATDTASMDYGQSSDFEVHQILGEANIWAVENLANAEALPETGTNQLFSLVGLKLNTCRLKALKSTYQGIHF